MAQRRLFSQDIVGSDAFLDMPVSSQALYFHLGMYADDDGFVNPKRIMRMMGASDDDLKVLISKRFVLIFDNGIIVIKHWLIHNTIRKDRYKETQYLDQKKLVFVKENGSYTDDGNQMATNGLPNGNQRLPQVKVSKGKLSKEKEIDKEKVLPKNLILTADEINELQQQHSGINVKEEYEKCKDYILATGKTYKDYKAMFRNWLRRVKSDDVPIDETKKPYFDAEMDAKYEQEVTEKFDKEYRQKLVQKKGI